MGKHLRGWTMSPRARRAAVAAAQLLGVGILIGVLWERHGHHWGLVAVGAVLFGWAFAVSWADS